MVLNAKLLVIAATVIAGAVFLVGNTFAKAEGTRPGWGKGDENHTHTGPPGQSVRPGHDDENEVNEDSNETEHHSVNSSGKNGKSGDN